MIPVEPPRGSVPAAKGAGPRPMHLRAPMRESYPDCSPGSTLAGEPAATDDAPAPGAPPAPKHPRREPTRERLCLLGTKVLAALATHPAREMTAGEIRFLVLGNGMPSVLRDAILDGLVAEGRVAMRRQLQVNGVISRVYALAPRVIGGGDEP